MLWNCHVIERTHICSSNGNMVLKWKSVLCLMDSIELASCLRYLFDTYRYNRGLLTKSGFCFAFKYEETSTSIV